MEVPACQTWTEGAVQGASVRLEPSSHALDRKTWPEPVDQAGTTSGVTLLGRERFEVAALQICCKGDCAADLDDGGARHHQEIVVAPDMGPNGAADRSWAGDGDGCEACPGLWLAAEEPTGCVH